MTRPTRRSGETEKPGNVCHECSDRTRLGRGCTKPLRSDELVDTRTPDTPIRCPVLGYDRLGNPDHRHPADFRARFWRALEVHDLLERCNPRDVPADLWEWSRVVRAEYQAAAQRWRDIDAAATSQARGR